MTRKRLVIAPLVVIVALAACAKQSPTLSPEATRAAQATEFVKRVGELQNAAIQAEATGGLTASQTRPIVSFCVAAARTAKDYPAGWEKTVNTAYREMKAALPVEVLKNPTAAFALAVVEGMLITLNGGVQ